MKKYIGIIIIALFIVSIVDLGCSSIQSTKKTDEGAKRIVATTTMIADLTRVIGGEYVEVEGLMGPGIDPHLYKASAGDVTKMQEADMVIFNGLHLEGKMGEIFEKLDSQDKKVIKISDKLEETRFLVSDDDASVHDPHIWFSVPMWIESAEVVKDGLVDLDPEHGEVFIANYEAYLKELENLDNYIRNRVKELPVEQRILITAHDAFKYFGHEYGFKVMGLQGISTASEAGTGDIKELVDFIVANEIKAVFVESSVPRKNIEALQEAVAAKGFTVEIGGELFSDSLGTTGTEAETYIGTCRSNIDTIIDELK